MLLRCCIGAALLAATVLARAPALAAITSDGQELTFGDAPHRISAEVFKSRDPTHHPHLIVVLHGDAPAELPDYQYVFAENAAAALRASVVVAVLRPGYADPQGHRSDGDFGHKTGDNYTPDVLANIAAAVQAARALYAAQDVTLVGHSGGAVIAADLVEIYPGLASRLLLVSCPCDLDDWRRRMFWKQLDPLWLFPTRSLSPLKGAARIGPSAKIMMLVGTDDDVAPSAVSDRFVAMARQAHTAVSRVVVLHAGHDMLLRETTLEALRRLEGP